VTATEESTGAAHAQPATQPASLIGAALPELALLTVMLLWASTFILTKDLFTQMTPLAFAFLRFLLIILLAFGVLAWRGRNDPARYWRIARADAIWFLLAGSCGYFFYQLGFVLGLDRTSPFASSLLISMMPLFTLILLRLMGERPSSFAWFGVVVAIGGVILFLTGQRGGGTWLGDLLSLGSALSFALYGILNRRIVGRYPAETVSAYSVLAGGGLLLLVSAPSAFRQDWGAVDLGAWLILLYMAVLPVYVAYILWNWAAHRRGVEIATSVELIVPVFSGILSVLFYGEEFGVAKLAGGALVLFGLVLMRLKGWPRLRSGRRNPEVAA
jgi:drug/metabolite transporter (DMT)-like permease